MLEKIEKDSMKDLKDDDADYYDDDEDYWDDDDYEDEEEDWLDDDEEDEYDDEYYDDEEVRTRVCCASSTSTCGSWSQRLFRRWMLNSMIREEFHHDRRNNQPFELELDANLFLEAGRVGH